MARARGLKRVLAGAATLAAAAGVGALVGGGLARAVDAERGQLGRWVGGASTVALVAAGGYARHRFQRAGPDSEESVLTPQQREALRRYLFASAAQSLLEQAGSRHAPALTPERARTLLASLGWSERDIQRLGRELWGRPPR